MPATAHAATDGVLIRLVVSGDRWAESIPPAPDGFDVSVSFGCEESADLHAAALMLLGYRVVVVPPGHPSELAADFLVPAALARAHPRWCRALLAQAERAYDLAFGPAAAAVAGVLRAHRPPRSKRR